MRRRGLWGSLLATLTLGAPALAQLPPPPYSTVPAPPSAYFYPVPGYPPAWQYPAYSPTPGAVAAPPPAWQYPAYAPPPGAVAAPPPAARAPFFGVGHAAPEAAPAAHQPGPPPDAVWLTEPAPAVATPYGQAPVARKSLFRWPAGGQGGWWSRKKHAGRDDVVLHYDPAAGGEIVEHGPACGDTGAVAEAPVAEPEACPAPCPQQEPVPFTPPGHRWYGSVEYLNWQVSDSPIPTLLTAGPGGPVLLGGDLNSVVDDRRNGGRFTLGKWLDEGNLWGLEGTFLFLAEEDGSFVASSDGGTPLARPFRNLVTGLPDASVLAAPGVAAGRFELREQTQLWSGEVNLREELYRGCYCHFDLLTGGRYLQLDDGIDILDATTTLADPAVTVSRRDSFDARNHVFGGQLGGALLVQKGRWFGDLWGKVLVGGNYQTVKVDGATTTAGGGLDGTLAGGLLARPGNIGEYDRTRFVVMPEVGVNLGFQLCQYARVKGGYSVLYIDRVVRPGDQIDTGINTGGVTVPGGAVPGLPGPSFQFRETDFWAHGFNASLEFRY